MAWQRNYMVQKEKQDIHRTYVCYFYGHRLFMFLLCFLCSLQKSDEHKLN